MLDTKNPLTLAALLAQIKSINEQITAHGRDLLGKAFKEFFDRCPEVRAVVWTQYAPRFNDGDPCTFSVNECEVVPFLDKIEPKLAADIAAQRDEDDDEYDCTVVYMRGDGCMLPYTIDDSTYASQKRVQAAFDEILALAFTEECESIMQVAFGDDCIVVATRDGFDIDEYAHD